MVPEWGPVRSARSDDKESLSFVMLDKAGYMLSDGAGTANHEDSQS